MTTETETQNPILTQWLAALHAPQDTTVLHAVVSDDVVLESYKDGKSGEPQRIEGIDAVTSWLERLPPDTWMFTPLAVSECEPMASLPAGDRALAVRYLLTSDVSDMGMGTYTHHGDWVLQIRGEQLVGIRHAPDDLSSDPKEHYSAGIDDSDQPDRIAAAKAAVEALGDTLEHAHSADCGHKHGHHDHDHDHASPKNSTAHATGHESTE